MVALTAGILCATLITGALYPQPRRSPSEQAVNAWQSNDIDAFRKAFADGAYPDFIFQLPGVTYSAAVSLLEATLNNPDPQFLEEVLSRGGRRVRFANLCENIKQKRFDFSRHAALLIRHGLIKVNEPCGDIENSGHSYPPIYHAILHGKTPMVHALVQAGADLSTRDAYYRRPLEFALIKGHSALRKVLTPARDGPVQLAGFYAQSADSKFFLYGRNRVRRIVAGIKEQTGTCEDAAKGEIACYFDNPEADAGGFGLFFNGGGEWIVFSPRPDPNPYRQGMPDIGFLKQAQAPVFEKPDERSRVLSTIKKSPDPLVVFFKVRDANGQFWFLVGLPADQVGYCRESDLIVGPGGA